MEDINLENNPAKARVITHSANALSQANKDWNICLAGKLYASGIMVWQDAERAAKFIWSHLKRNDHWDLM
ncbi:hypothetical protein MKX03_013020, partial [Papaver bracteatum]